MGAYPLKIFWFGFVGELQPENFFRPSLWGRFLTWSIFVVGKSCQNLFWAKEPVIYTFFYHLVNFWIKWTIWAEAMAITVLALFWKNRGFRPWPQKSYSHLLGQMEIKTRRGTVNLKLLNAEASSLKCETAYFESCGAILDEILTFWKILKFLKIFDFWSKIEEAITFDCSVHLLKV